MPGVTTISSPRTPYQFRLRGLLLGSLPLAVFFALLGVVYRGSSADVRWVLALAAAACVAACVVGLTLQYQIRLAARHAAGHELLRVESTKTKRTPVVLAAAALLLSLHASIGLVSWQPRGREHLALVVAGVPAVLCFFVWVLFWFDRYDLEVCHKGIILNGLWFRPWRDVTGHVWPEGGPGSVELRLGASRHTILIPVEQTAAVDELLRRYGGRETASSPDVA